MNMSKAQKSIRGPGGFTLVELLVVIAIIAILASLLTPVVQEALTKGRMTQTLSNGSQIYKVLFARYMEGATIFPTSIGVSSVNAFSNSTDFFRYLVRDRIIDVNFSFFSASGLQSYGGIDPYKFRAEHNAWCIAADISESTRNITPVLFTRNLQITTLNDARLVSPYHVRDDGIPYGRRGVVVIHKGGDGEIQKYPLDPETFNPADETNPILRPRAAL